MSVVKCFLPKMGSGDAMFPDPTAQVPCRKNLEITNRKMMQVPPRWISGLTAKKIGVCAHIVQDALLHLKTQLKQE